MEIEHARRALKVAIRLMQRRRRRLELLIDEAYLVAGNLSAIGQAMPEDRLTAHRAGAEQERDR